ncbi:substrate-binding domain-containing protein [Nocardia amamiensis]|uniref:substrate-binding domain-containing protein n=1 Tax=Nocardia amamiensis TaxID=404578 RepID=UPI0035A21E95
MPVSERLRGYYAAFEAHQLRFDHGLIRLDVEGAAEAKVVADELLDLADPPTALFTLSNQFSFGAIRALHERGLSNDRALVGFDDFALADMLHPPVSVITHDITEMGRVATERLLARINGDTSPRHSTTLPVQLIKRGSGEIPPSR